MNELYSRLIEFTRDGVYRYTFDDGKILFANRGFARILDLDMEPGEIVGRRLKELMIYTEKAGLVREHLERNGEIHGYEYHFKTLGGEDRWVIHDSFIITDAATGERVVEAIVKDITERKLAEWELAAEKERLAVTLSSIGDGVIAADRNGRVVLLNDVAEELTGWRQAEAIGRPVDEVFHIVNEFSRGRVENPVHRVLQTGRIVGLANHTALIARDGTERSIADSGAPIRMRNGDIAGVVLVFRDVTDMRRAQESIEENIRRFRSLFAHMISAFAYHEIVTDASGKPVDYVFLDVNDSFEKMTGLMRDDVIGRKVTEVLPGTETDPADWIGTYGKVALTGEPLEFEQLSQVLGRWYAVSAYSPRKGFFAVTFQDITARKAAEEALLHLNRIYAVLSYTNQAIVRIRDRSALLQEVCNVVVDHGQFTMAWIGMVDSETRQVHCAAQAGMPHEYLEVLNITADDVPAGRGPTGTAIREGRRVVCNDFQMDPAILPHWRSTAAKFGYRSSAAFPIRVRSRVVGAFNIYSSNPGFFDEREIQLLEELTADISLGLEHIEQEELREAAEDALRTSENRYRALAEAAHDMIFIINSDGIVHYVNSFAAQTLGATPAEIIGKPRERLFPAEISKRQEGALRRVIETGAPTYIESPSSFNGSELWLGTWLVPLRDGLNGGMGVLGISRDITERIQAEEELRRARDELETRVEERTRALTLANRQLKTEIRERRRTEKQVRKVNTELEERTRELETANKELAAFSYSVSHDLRTPLYSIDGFAKILQDLYADRLDDQGKEFLSYIREACLDLTELINGLLSLSLVTRSEMTIEEIDLSAAAKAIAADLQKAQPKRDVQFAVQDGLAAKGDARLLKIMLENLLSNAWKFTGRQPQALIEFGAARHRGRPSFYIRDNGAGFDMAFAGKLFGDFQRLHASTEFEGNGIGLATVKRIVERHGGRVWAKGEVGKGATFYFSL